MKQIPQYLALAVLGCAAAPFVTADQSSSPSPWRSLLEDHGAPAWRGWKDPGLPAGWHVEGGVLAKDGKVDDLVTNDTFGPLRVPRRASAKRSARGRPNPGRLTRLGPPAGAGRWPRRSGCASAT